MWKYHHTNLISFYLLRGILMKQELKETMIYTTKYRFGINRKIEKRWEIFNEIIKSFKMQIKTNYEFIDAKVVKEIGKCWNS